MELRRESLAQSVEHLTFNQGVRGSNPRWFTNREESLCFLPCFFYFVGIRIPEKLSSVWGKYTSG